MRKLLVVLIIIVSVYMLITVRRMLRIQNSEFTDNSPRILEVSCKFFRGEFTVTMPALIYWRLMKTPSCQPLMSDFTNTEQLDGLTAYGGGIVDKGRLSYTNFISNLEPNTSYDLYAVVVSKVGTYPKKHKKLTFTTKVS